MIKSPIKWAGGKSWLLPQLQELFNDSNCLHFLEPMCGSAVLSMNIKCDGYRQANDINWYLINFFHHIQKGIEIDVNKFEMTKEEYYETRTRFNSGNISSIDNAVDFYYLNRAGFNGLYRENKDGEFNVPWGKRKSIKRIEREAYDAIKGIIFTSFNVNQIKPFENSFIYLDPPYYGTFSQYNAKGFTINDFEDIVIWAKKYGEKVVISNTNHPHICKILTYHGFTYTLVEAPRRIRNQPPVMELLAKNF